MASAVALAARPKKDLLDFALFAVGASDASSRAPRPRFHLPSHDEDGFVSRRSFFNGLLGVLLLILKLGQGSSPRELPSHTESPELAEPELPMEPGEQVPDSPRPVVEREVLQVVDTPDPIPSALPSEEPVRAFAVRGVGAFGAVEFIPTLIGMLKDPSAEVREAVVDAVKQLSSQPAPKQEAQAEAGS